MKKIRSYFRGVAIEAKRVRWPNRSQLWSAVGKVVFITILFALVLLLCDWLAAEVVRAFQRQTPSESSSSSSAAAAIRMLLPLLPRL